MLIVSVCLTGRKLKSHAEEDEEKRKRKEKL
jgi:hypothetical protein